MDKIILKLTDVDYYYPLQGLETFHALKNISLWVEEGEILGLVGESGSGKSTLAKVMLGISGEIRGEIRYKGKDIHGKSWRKMKVKPIQMVLQDSKSSLNPKMTLFQSMEEPLILSGMKENEKREKRIREICLQVGLDMSTAGKFPGACSGGQRQRASIGRALLLSPELLILDEPVSSLDVSIQGQIMNLLQDISEKMNTTIVFISHNERLVDHFCTRVVRMEKGRLLDENHYRNAFDKKEQEKEPVSYRAASDVLPKDHGWVSDSTPQ